MGNSGYGKIIAKNLKRIAYENQKTQADIARDLRLTQSTVSSWMLGTRIPRMDKIDMLCNYFNVSRAEIMEEEPQHYQEFVKPEERELLRLFRSLNAFGKEVAIDQIEAMTKMDKWTRERKKPELSIS